MRGRIQLDDLHELCERYVPLRSRHPKARGRSTLETWWPAHEHGHLLTVPRARIGEPLFGMDVDISPSHPHATTWWAYELAAMHVSRRLLISCRRPELFFEAHLKLGWAKDPNRTRIFTPDGDCLELDLDVDECANQVPD